jgi:predicted nucleotidyltransferase
MIALQMNPLAAIEQHLAELRALGARRIGVFGSFARGQERADSDVDVYVEFEEAQRTYDNFFALHERLEQLCGRRVDLVTDQSLTQTKARLILPTVRYAADHA